MASGEARNIPQARPGHKPRRATTGACSLGRLIDVPPSDSRKPTTDLRRPRQDAAGNKLPDPNEELAFFEQEIAELKVAFEQFFMGIERKSPQRRRDAFAERMRKLKASGQLRNTALKFRMDQLFTRFQTYDRMWTRTIQEMEAGTYRRDVLKLKRKQDALAQPKPRATTKAAAPPEPASPPPLSEGQLRQLFDTYVMARKRTNESVAGVTFEGLSSTLRKQVPELMKKHEAKAIDFKVVIKDGKALLKAVPRK